MTIILATLGAEQEGHEFEASTGKGQRPRLKKKEGDWGCGSSISVFAWYMQALHSIPGTSETNR
jgi:hypothetical protein